MSAAWIALVRAYPARHTARKTGFVRRHLKHRY